MPHGLFQTISGREGEVRIETLGVLVGTFEKWTLRRRGDDGPGSGLYDLTAVFSYVNPHLWGDDEYTKSIHVVVSMESRKERLRIEQEPGYETQLTDRKSLRMMGVKLCQ